MHFSKEVRDYARTVRAFRVGSCCIGWRESSVDPIVLAGCCFRSIASRGRTGITFHSARPGRRGRRSLAPRRVQDPWRGTLSLPSVVGRSAIWSRVDESALAASRSGIWRLERTRESAVSASAPTSHALLGARRPQLAPLTMLPLCTTRVSRRSRWCSVGKGSGSPR